MVLQLLGLEGRMVERYMYYASWYAACYLQIIVAGYRSITT